MALESAALFVSQLAQGLDLLWGVIGQRVGFEPAPAILDGIEFGCIGRQPFQPEAPVALDKLLDCHGPMSFESIPDDHHRSPNPAPQLAQEGPHQWTHDGLLHMQAETPTHSSSQRTDHQCRDDRYFQMMPGALLEHRRLALRMPGAPQIRSHQQAALIHEDQCRFQLTDFFLMRGHCTLTHRRIATSSRSRARRSGRCGLQPKERNNRPK